MQSQKVPSKWYQVHRAHTHFHLNTEFVMRSEKPRCVFGCAGIIYVHFYCYGWVLHCIVRCILLLFCSFHVLCLLMSLLSAHSFWTISHIFHSFSSTAFFHFDLFALHLPFFFFLYDYYTVKNSQFVYCTNSFVNCREFDSVFWKKKKNLFRYQNSYCDLENPFFLCVCDFCIASMWLYFVCTSLECFLLISLVGHPNCQIWYFRIFNQHVLSSSCLIFRSAKFGGTRFKRDNKQGTLSNFKWWTWNGHK